MSGWLRLMITFCNMFSTRVCNIFTRVFEAHSLHPNAVLARLAPMALWRGKINKGFVSKQINTAKSKDSPAFVICLEPLTISHWYHDWIAPKSQLLRNRGLRPTSDKIRREICDTLKIASVNRPLRKKSPCTKWDCYCCFYDPSLFLGSQNQTKTFRVQQQQFTLRSRPPVPRVSFY